MTVDTAVSTAVDMAAETLFDLLDNRTPDPQEWVRALDMGTVRVRIRVDVEPTGKTPEQALAEVVASDPAESLEARAAARTVLAGGPGLDAAMSVLSWPL
ncbi:hypothetical protein ACWDBT_00555 [Streptomyces ardesiacus]